MSIGFLAAALSLASPTLAPAPAEPIVVLKDAVVLPPVAVYGRQSIHLDPIQLAIARGAWAAPKEGDHVKAFQRDEGERAWDKAAAEADGWLRHDSLRNGYAFATVHSDTERVMILEARSHAMVYVNGEPRMGDPYSLGNVRLPVLLRKGDNQFLFSCGRGEVQALLTEPPASVAIDLGDITTPDSIIGENTPLWASVMVQNNLLAPVEHVALTATCGEARQENELPVIPALSSRKVAIKIPAVSATDPGERKVRLEIFGPHGKPMHHAELTVNVRKPTELHKRTFISEIDGSVQYYAVNPATVPDPKGLILSLHGASVEGLGQAACYGPRDWAAVVSPTNRRPYGFDWEDWGMLDGIEVLHQARALLPSVEDGRVYVSGHSMGGHGTWVFATMFPGVFAAAAPSAGWPSFWSYAGARKFDNPNPIERQLARSTDVYDTVGRIQNLRSMGVYILHGDADDNVRVDQARTMRAELAKFHPDFTYYERPGAGHWWGNECVSWGPMMDFLKARVNPKPTPMPSVDAMWTQARSIDEGHTRIAGFKAALNHRFVLVYGTGGSAEEAAWAKAKARFDAEQWWYRGNGSVDVYSDTAGPAAFPGRTIVLYGNADTNKAWPSLLAGSPVQVSTGKVKIGETEFKGDDLYCLLVRPREGAAGCNVVAVSGTGPAGMRATDRMPYFVSGTGFPDYLVGSADTLKEGTAALKAAGFFKPDWALDPDQTATAALR